MTETLVRTPRTRPVADDYGIHEVPAVLPSTGEPGRRRRRLGRPAEAGTRVLAFDGLRGVAVLAVIAFHEGFLGGGFLGVDIFFVLSGFLITGLLLPGRASGSGRNGGLAAFWARRVRRLLPAMLLLLLTIQLWLRVGAPASQWRLVNGQTQAALAYVGNWYAVVARSGYWEAGAEQTPLLHLWSLAVEEQFYLLWPVVVAAFLRVAGGRVRRWMTSATLGMAGASLVATPFIYRAHGQDRAYYGTDTRVGVILLGAALAFHASQRSETGTEGWRRRGASLLVAASVGWLLLACVVLRPGSPALFHGGLAATGLATTVLIADITRNGTGLVARTLGRGALVWIGERSYGLYLWSWPTSTILDRSSIRGAELIVAKALLMLLFTLLSHRLVERPFRAGRWRGLKLLPRLVVPVGVVAALSLAWQPARPDLFGDEQLVAHGHGGAGTLRVLVVGDSWARGLGIGLAKLEDAGGDSILNDGLGSCGIADLPTRVAGGWRPVDPDCARWPQRWASDLVSFDPDAVILTTGSWDQAEAELDGRSVRPADPAFQRHYSSQLDEALRVLSTSRARVYVTTVVDNPAPDARQWSDAMNELLRAGVRRHRGVSLLDFRSRLCPRPDSCPSRLDGIDVYDDTHHLTARWQARVAGWVRETLGRDIGGRNEAEDTAARAELAGRVLPSPAVILGPQAQPVSTQHPARRELLTTLVPGASSDVLELASLATGVVVVGDNGETDHVALVRFSDDRLADGISVDALKAHLEQGWERVALAGTNRVVLTRGIDILLIVRSPHHVALVRAEGGTRQLTPRSLEILDLAPLLSFSST